MKSYGCLKRENERLRRERDILKKAVAIFSDGPASVFGFISEHRTVWSVLEMCRVLEMSRSGYYRWFKRKPSRTSSWITRVWIPRFAKFMTAVKDAMAVLRSPSELRDRGRRGRQKSCGQKDAQSRDTIQDPP